MAGAHPLALACSYLCNPREALTSLNASRKDPAWSARALTQMVEICLNPDEDVTWSEAAADAPGCEGRASAPGDGKAQGEADAAGTAQAGLRHGVFHNKG